MVENKPNDPYSENIICITWIGEGKTDAYLIDTRKIRRCVRLNTAFEEDGVKRTRRFSTSQHEL